MCGGSARGPPSERRLRISTPNLVRYAWFQVRIRTSTQPDPPSHRVMPKQGRLLRSPSLIPSPNPATRLVTRPRRHNVQRHALQLRPRPQLHRQPEAHERYRRAAPAGACLLHPDQQQEGHVLDLRPLVGDQDGGSRVAGPGLTVRVVQHVPRHGRPHPHHGAAGVELLRDEVELALADGWVGPKRLHARGAQDEFCGCGSLRHGGEQAEPVGDTPGDHAEEGRSGWWAVSQDGITLWGCGADEQV